MRAPPPSLAGWSEWLSPPAWIINTLPFTSSNVLLAPLLAGQLHHEHWRKAVVIAKVIIIRPKAHACPFSLGIMSASSSTEYDFAALFVMLSHEPFRMHMEAMRITGRIFQFRRKNSSVFRQAYHYSSGWLTRAKIDHFNIHYFSKNRKR